MTNQHPTPFRRLRALFHRRVRHRITRGGALFTMAMLLTGAGAFLSANNLLFLVFSAMPALVLISGFISRLVLAGLELELLLPEYVSARCPATAIVRLRNLKRLTPSFSIELSGRRDRLTNAPSILTAPVYFPLIPGGSVAEARVEVTFPRRGRHRENLFVLSTGFPFGFLRKSTTVPLHRETVVYPSLEPQPGFEDIAAETAGEVEAQSRGAGQDFYRIRPYETTDSARLVDWKSTAHTGSLQVREFSREQRQGVEICLDRRIPPGRNAWFEHAVELCAFLVWTLADLGVRVHAHMDGRTFAIPEQDDVHAALRYLALLEPLAIAGDAGPAAAGDVPEPPFDAAGVQIVFSAFPEAFESAGWSPLRTGSPDGSPMPPHGTGPPRDRSL